MAKEREPISCAVCGMMFVPQHGNSKVCSAACRDERQRNNVRSWQRIHSPASLRKAEKQTVADILRYAAKHQKKTGVYLSYGQAVAKMAAEGYRT